MMVEVKEFAHKTRAILRFFAYNIYCKNYSNIILHLFQDLELYQKYFGMLATPGNPYPFGLIGNSHVKNLLRS